MFFKKFSSVLKSYVLKMKEIDLRKQNMMEDFEKKCLKTAVGLKSIKAAKNFGNMIFGNS